MGSFISELEAEDNLAFVVVNSIQHHLSRRLRQICRYSLCLYREVYELFIPKKSVNFKTLAK